MPYYIKKVKDGYKVCKKTKCFSKEGMPEERAKKQLKAIGLSGGLKPITARVGGKVLLKKKIVDEYFPSPDSYSTYVEPFVGGGSIYFYKNKEGHKEVVNDIDPDIYTLFKGLQSYPAKKIAEDINGDYTKKDFEEIQESEPEDAYHKFLKTYLLYKLSYFGRGLSFGKPRVNTSFQGYQERLKGVDITKEDYKGVIEKYNKPDTFFYLDPPVRESQGAYKFPAINFVELAKVLHTIKGKFLLSIGKSSIQKELFRDFTVIPITTKYVGEKTKGGQTKKTKEFLVLNYQPGVSGSGLRGGCKGCMGACGGSMVKFHKQLAEVGLTHNIYMKKAKELAKASGYDPEKLTMAEDEDHKLCYDGICFGKVTYFDYIIYSWLESRGEIPEGTADKKRKAYRARAKKARGDWKNNKLSPNNLAINILW
jgi:DNA adenine methylase